MPARGKIREPDNDADQHRQQPYLHWATSLRPALGDQEATQVFKEQLLERRAATAYLGVLS